MAPSTPSYTILPPPDRTILFMASSDSLAGPANCNLACPVYPGASRRNRETKPNP